VRRIEYKYIVATVFVIGLFMDLLDSTVVNVALPALGRQFHAGTSTIEWTVTGYLLSLAVFIPVSGWAGDRFGTKRTFLFALTVFTLGSALCGLAQSIDQLIAFRVLQGVGGGMLTPVGSAMLYRAFPPAERARASSILIVPAVFAPSSGPIVGGWLVTYATWRWVFYINLPMGVIGLLVAGFLLREQREPNAGRFDPTGFLLSATGLSSLLYALAQAGDRGFGDGRVLGFGLAGVTLLTAFVLFELRTARPMLQMRLFGNRLFAATNVVQLFAMGGQFGMLFLMPLFLQTERGLTALQSGLTTFPQAIGICLMTPFVGRIYPRVGPRRTAAFGLLLGAIGTFGLMTIDLTTSEWTIRGYMLLRGVGFAFSLIAMQTAAFANVSGEETGRASAIYSVTRQVATSFVVALLATVLDARLSANHATLGNPRVAAGAVAAFHAAFFVAALIVAGGVVAALLIDDRLAAGTMRTREATSDALAVPALSE
jgi:EmrB/QacA subfamily drug resistance transporter